MASLKNTVINDTGNITLPNGTTGERPSASNGMMRYNTSTGNVEIYNGATSTWNPITNNTYNIEILLVGGGGGGGGNNAYFYGGGGGGGGGGVLYVSSYSVTKNSTYSITIGAGGTGGRQKVSNATSNIEATKGSDTTGFGYTAYGGGAGMSYFGSTSGTLLNGGSGGGGARDNNGSRGTGTAGQGNAGGYGGGTSCASAGGGGGSGGTGYNGCGDCNATRSPSTCGNGGVGTTYSWSGSSVYYGGGGGGAFEGTTTQQQPLGGNGTGSSGGNGTVATDEFSPYVWGTPGLSNTGNGGGGGGHNNGLSGGSGVLMIRYPGTPIGEGGTIVYSGGYTVHIFNGSGTYKG